MTIDSQATSITEIKINNLRANGGSSETQDSTPLEKRATRRTGTYYRDVADADQNQGLIPTFKVAELDRRNLPRAEAEEGIVSRDMTDFPVVHYSLYEKAYRRAMDLALVGLGLIALMPMLIVVGVLVKLTSKGPMFFKQKRVGRGGRHFMMLKFRTMYENAEDMKKDLMEQNEKDGPIFKMKNDPRITKIGGFLRRHSIDELPQLWNVIMGDMSVVGPRPSLPSEVEYYRLWQTYRLSAVPGLTCIWQVSGRSNISFTDWMRMDIRYIENRSLWLDIKLIFKTIKIVITGDGAY